MFLPYKNRIVVLFSLIIGLLMLTPTPAAFAINDLFVNSTGIDTWAGAPNDCRQTVWFGIVTPPCRTLAHAISQASNGDTIHASGTFNEHSLILNKNITIEGGLVDANGLGRHFEIRSGKSVILRSIDLKNGVSVAGGSIFNQGNLTYEGGYVTDNQADSGGAIYNTIEGTAVLENLFLLNNEATLFEGGTIFNAGSVTVDSSFIQDSTAATFGGVIFNSEYGDAHVWGSSIYDSTAKNGGAIFNSLGEVYVISSTIVRAEAKMSGGAITNAQGDLFVEGSTLMDNEAGENGGAIFNTTDNNGNVFILEVEFTDNTAGNHGGAIYDLSANTSWNITNSTFVGNHAELRGGALFLLGNSQVNILATSENESLFRANSAVLYGGAIYNEVNLTIENTTLNNNAAWEGGAVFNTGSGNLIIDRTALLNNTGHFRGGALFDDSTGTFTTVNSTYSGNNSLSFGGAIFYEGALARLANVTLYGNSSYNGSGIYTGSTVQMHNSIITASSVEDCAVTGAGAFSGQNNLVDDFAAGPCSGISPDAISQIDSALTGTPAVHTINGLSNAYDNGHSSCPDPLNGFAPLAVDQQENNRLGADAPCDIGAFELH